MIALLACNRHKLLALVEWSNTMGWYGTWVWLGFWLLEWNWPKCCNWVRQTSIGLVQINELWHFPLLNSTMSSLSYFSPWWNYSILSWNCHRPSFGSQLTLTSEYPFHFIKYSWCPECVPFLGLNLWARISSASCLWETMIAVGARLDSLRLGSCLFG